MAGYAVYNYAFYLFGAALNVFFPLYVVSFLVGILTLGRLLSHLDVTVVADSFRRDAPVRLVDGYLVFVAVGLAVVWLGMWGAYAFAGRPTPIEPEAFKIVAALDLSLMVPALAVGGVMLWRRTSWGYVIATIAAIQGALYLLVLSVNSAIAIRRGLVPGPGELLIWGPLTIFTTMAAILLWRSASRTSPPTGREDVSQTMWIRYLLGALLAFGAINAVAGGYYGLSGAPGVPLTWLAGSPFKDYFIPSLILFVVVGGAFLFAAVAVFARSRLARVSSFGAGAVVLVWIAVQFTIIGRVSWMQPATLIAGILVLILAWLMPSSSERRNRLS
jgi:hypothetical protein